MPSTYTVKSGDTKASLQKKFGIQLNDAQYRSSDPNKLFAGEVLKIASPVQGPEQYPGQLRPVIDNGKVNISNVKEGVTPMVQGPEQYPGQLRPPTNTNGKTTEVVSYKDNPDGTTTNTTADGGSDTGRYIRNADGTLTFVPASGGTTTTKSQTNDGGLPTEIKTLQDEITAIETRMTNRSQERNNALDSAGVFEDLRLLNEKKAALREAQDRGTEIKIKGRQTLRGRQATKAEFNQLTSPDLEKNVLEELAASRSVSRLTDDINTNINIIDSQIDALTKQDEFLYKQKSDRLETVTKVYGDIMTEQQKQAAEARKFQYDLALEGVKTENSLRSDLLKDIAKKGVVGGELQNVMAMPIEDLITYNANLSSPVNWSGMTLEEAAQKLSPEDFTKYKAFKELEVKDQEVVAQALGVQTGARDTVDLITKMLNDTEGLNNSVGFGLGNKDFNIFGLGNESATFRANAKQLLSQATLNKLLELKNSGGTLGALSEGELKMLDQAATALNPIKDDKGNITGRFEIDEEDFKSALKTMRIASMKTYVAATLGKAAYGAANLQNADYATVSKLYEELKTNGARPVQDRASTELPNSSGRTVSYNGSPSYYSPSKALSVAFDTIKREEGLRTTAYQDVGGKWTIGFGNTMINGRPVQPGDKLSVPQAEALMQKSVVQNYTNFVDKITAPLTPNQFAALTSFEYNLGGGVWNSQTGRQILSSIENGLFSQAGKLMLAYNKVRNPRTGVLEPNQVLAQRRAREANLLLT